MAYLRKKKPRQPSSGRLRGKTPLGEEENQQRRSLFLATLAFGGRSGYPGYLTASFGR